MMRNGCHSAAAWCMHACGRSRRTVVSLVLVAMLVGSEDRRQLPTVVWIVVEEVGTADVGYNARLQGSVADHDDVPIRTPSIDALAYSGARLKNYYAHTDASSSRQALLTSRYKFSAGCSAFVKSTTTVAHELKERGYKSHFVGRWGFDEGGPTRHGFDSHVGAEVHSQRERSAVEPHNEVYTREAIGLVRRQARGDLQGGPLFLVLNYDAVQASARSLQGSDCMGHGLNWKRREQCAYVTSIDDGVGNLTDVLREEGLFEEVLVVLTAASSGVPTLGAYSYPFRGYRGTGWDGGMHLPSFIYAPRRVPAQVFSGIFHVTDWAPTIVGMLDIESPRPLRHLAQRHGVDQAESIHSNGRGVRRSMVLECDCSKNLTVLVQRKEQATWKLLLGTVGDGRVISEHSYFWSVGGAGADIHDKIEEVLRAVAYFVLGNTDAALSWHLALAAGTALLRDSLRGTEHAAIAPEIWGGDSHHCMEPLPVTLDWQRVLLFRLDEDPYEQHNLAHEYVDVVKHLVADHNEHRSEMAAPCGDAASGAHVTHSKTVVLGLLLIVHLIFLAFALFGLRLLWHIRDCVYPGPKPKPE